MKLSLFTDMILHLKDSVDCAGKFIDLINTFNKVAKFTNIQKSAAFININNN